MYYVGILSLNENQSQSVNSILLRKLLELADCNINKPDIIPSFAKSLIKFRFTSDNKNKSLKVIDLLSYISNFDTLCEEVNKQRYDNFITYLGKQTMT